MARGDSSSRGRVPPSSPVISWGVASQADRDLFLQDSHALSGWGCAPASLISFWCEDPEEQLGKREAKEASTQTAAHSIRSDPEADRPDRSAHWRNAAHLLEQPT